MPQRSKIGVFDSGVGGGNKAVTISAPITIHSTDPDTTGAAVQKHINRLHRDLINESPAGGF